MSDSPLASIIIVNYNGAHYLRACLDALQRQTLPADAFEVILSDNGSTDGSQELLRGEYPWVRLLENGRNLGFTGGNNVAFKQAHGRDLVLLNNDTAPAPDWLENLLAPLSDPQVGLVTGHLQLFYDQIEISLHAPAFDPPGDARSLGVQVFGVDSPAPRSVTQYLEGFHGQEGSGGSAFRWTQADARLGLPVPPGDDGWTVQFRLSSGAQARGSVPVHIELHGETLAAWQVPPGDPVSFTLEIPAAARAFARPVEQNTGSIVFASGAGRDRGTYVRGTEVFYETSAGQYGHSEEVFAGCGASLLLRRAMLDEVGWLDEDFFMYYEDTDLSWRARLMGWKVLYAAPAQVRHIHCGTTREWSAGFVHMTERNRLAMVFKNGSPSQVLRVWGGYKLKVLTTGLQALGRLALFRPGWRMAAGQVRIHLRVLASLAGWLPALLRKRSHIQRRARVAPRQLEGWFVR